MAIVLIVEDGSIVADANSLASLDTLRNYALSRGVTLSDDDDIVGAQAIKAMDWIAAQEPRLSGQRVSEAQELPFPRCGLRVNGWYIEPTTIPRQAVSLQAQLVIDQKNGVDIMPTSSGAVKSRVKVGPIETDYLVSVGMDGRTPDLAAANALLQTLTGGGGRLFTERA